MQDTNIHTSVYEQIINRLFKLKLNIREEIERGFTYAPFGCKIVLEEKAKRNVKWLPADEGMPLKVASWMDSTIPTKLTHLMI